MKVIFNKPHGKEAEALMEIKNKPSLSWESAGHGWGRLGFSYSTIIKALFDSPVQQSLALGLCTALI